MQPEQEVAPDELATQSSDDEAAGRWRRSGSPGAHAAAAVEERCGFDALPPMQPRGADGDPEVGHRAGAKTTMTTLAMMGA